MGRSRETFGKKENEKKRQQKRKEKEERKEERQAHSSRGKGLDSMLAYVDENGNLTSTPPDRSKFEEVNPEDIMISTPKDEDMPQEDPVHTGKVTFFNDNKGYGFIRDIQNGKDIFVHINSLSEPVMENDKVSFEIEMGKKGPVAVSVKKI